MKNILVTGSAGFIGAHLSLKLLKNGFNVFGIDNLNDYYDVNLKKSRLDLIESFNLNEAQLYNFYQIDISNQEALEDIYKKHSIDCVINLAAQAGVRYSIDHPEKYVSSNLVGFSNVLELSKKYNIKHLLFASSSSVYGMSTDIPFRVDQNTDYPISLYAATKKSNELMAFSYSHLYKIPITGLRFFTVYGPYGRPDMAYFKFAKLINDGKKITVYNNGKMTRDFTYIDDITDGILKSINNIPNKIRPSTSSASAYFKIYNLGNNKPVNLLDFIKIIGKELNKELKIEFLPMQPGDVVNTYADISESVNNIGFSPQTNISKGLHEFIKWYLSYYD